MTLAADRPTAHLERVFHEPSRLAILSELCATAGGVTFNGLKETCDLTDGNLCRHLRTLEEAGVVGIRKERGGARMRSRVFLTDEGRRHFQTYLETLQEVLMRAAEALATEPAAPSELAASALPEVTRP